MHEDDAAAFETFAEPLGLLEFQQESADADPANQVVAHRRMEALRGEGVSAVELAVELGLFKSKGEARREIQSANSGFHVGGRQVTELDFRITVDLLGGRKVLQLRKGKKNKRMVCFHVDG